MEKYTLISKGFCVAGINPYNILLEKNTNNIMVKLTSEAQITIKSNTRSNSPKTGMMGVDGSTTL